MQAALAATGFVLIAASALPLLRADAWWIRWLDFPRLQILAALAVVLAACLALQEGGLLSFALDAGLALSIGYQAYMMFPYTRLARKQVESSRFPGAASTVRLFFVNVLMSNRRSERLKAMIRAAAPDLVLAVEPDEWWRRELAYLRATHPYALEHPRGNTYGMVLYSRLPLIAPRVHFLVEEDVPSIHARLRLASGAEVELRCLHPRPPGPQSARESTRRDAELLVVGKALKGLDRPAIVLGDLNDVAWSRTSALFRKVSGLLDPRVGRGFYSTFHARYPFLRYPLDHCFHSRHFRLVAFRRLGYLGSDHFPVLVALSLEPEAARRQPRLRPDAAERREAEAKVAAGGRE